MTLHSSAVQLAEVILAYIWRVARSGFPASMGKIILVIDEFQNMNLGVGSTLRRVLCEGRKFGLNLLLVTQTLGRYNREIKSMLNQAASHLYFHPVDSDIVSSARAIDPLMQMAVKNHSRSQDLRRRRRLIRHERKPLRNCIMVRLLFTPKLKLPIL